MAMEPARKKRLIVLGSILGIMFFLGIASMLMPSAKTEQTQTVKPPKTEIEPDPFYDEDEETDEDEGNGEKRQLRSSLEGLKFQPPAEQKKEEKKTVSAAEDTLPDNIQILADGVKADTVQISDKKGRWNPVAGSRPESGTLAERLMPENGPRLRWVPKLITGDTMPVRLTDAKPAPDGSVIAFVETTGPLAGPYGSRIVLMDTNSWTTLKICRIPNRHIVRIEWIPGKDGWLGAICRLYDGEEKQLPGLALIDLNEGKEKYFHTLPANVGKTGFISNGKTKLLMSHPVKPVLCVADAAVPEDPVREIAAPGPNCTLALSADGKCFAALPAENAKRIDIYKTADLLPLANVKWGGNKILNPAQPHFARNNRTFLVCSRPESNDPAYYVTDGQLLALPGYAPGKNDVSSGRGAVSADGRFIYSLLYGNNDLCVINTADCQLSRAIAVNDLTPRPSKRPALIARFFLLPRMNVIAALDDAGVFYLIKTTQQKQGKLRDERAIIFAPQQ